MLVLCGDGGFRAETHVRCVATADGPDGVLDTHEVFADRIGGGETAEHPVTLPQVSDALVDTFWRVSCATS